MPKVTNFVVAACLSTLYITINTILVKWYSKYCYVSLLLSAVTGSCTEKRKVIFLMNINKQTVSRNLNRSSAIRRFEPSNAVEICDGITFDFYTGLQHALYYLMCEKAILLDIA